MLNSVSNTCRPIVGAYEVYNLRQKDTYRHTIYWQGAGSTNYYWCPPPPLKLLGLPASITRPVASLRPCERNGRGLDRLRTDRQKDKQTNRWILGPGEQWYYFQTADRSGVFIVISYLVLISSTVWIYIVDSPAKIFVGSTTLGTQSRRCLRWRPRLAQWHVHWS